MALCAALAVHPRERGERVLPADSRLRQNGSSPRARGTGIFLLKFSANARFIPASAGNGARGDR